MKAEDVNVSKELVLFGLNKPVSFTSREEIIQKLGLKETATGKASFRVKPSDIPKGFDLYVQSTSNTRKLSAGFVLVRGYVEGDELLEPAPPRKKRKITEDSAGEDPHAEREKPQPGSRKKSNNKQDWLIRWDDFNRLPDVDVEVLHDMVEVTDQAARDAVDDMNTPIPSDLLTRLHSQIFEVLVDAKWSAPSEKDIRGHYQGMSEEDGMSTLMIWESPVSAGKNKTPHKLLYYVSPVSGDIIIALERKRDFAVCFGLIVGTPSITTNGVCYVSDECRQILNEPMPGTPTPRLVLIRLLTYIWEIGHHYPKDPESGEVE